MAFLKLFIGLYLIAFFTLRGISTQKEHLKFTLSIKKRDITHFKELIIKYSFLNISDSEPIIVPKHFIYGFDYIDFVDSITNPNIKWEIEKLNDNLYEKQKLELQHLPIPLYYDQEDLYDTIQLKKKISHELPFYGFYIFSKGEYRIRAKFIVPEICKINSKILYSNWIKFKINSDNLYRIKK